MSYEQLNQKYDFNKNSSKQDITYQIDDIINKYKTQLAELKQKSTKRNNSYIYEPVQSKTIKNDISPNLSKEIQNDNIKLQSLLTEEKLKTSRLKAQVENYENELKKIKQEMNELNIILNNKEKEYNQTISDMEGKINNVMNDQNSLLNKNIIQNFFELYNKYIDIFYKSKIISLNNAQKINYLQNDSEGQNHQMAIFVVNNFDILIKKLLQDNKELYEQLIEVRKVMDQQNIIQRELEGMKEIKEENLILKNKIEKISNENNKLKNDNKKLKNNLIELNNYMENRFDNYNLNNHMKRNMTNNSNNNIFNHKNQGMHSYNNIYNNFDFNYKKVNNTQNFTTRRDYNKSSDIKNIGVSMNRKKLNIDKINSNYSSRPNKIYNEKSYSKTDENRNRNNILNNYDQNALTLDKNINNINSNINGFERPIEKLKKKIMILEQQIKNNPE